MNPQEIKNPIGVQQEGEQTICEIRRHPIGILGIYFVAGLLLVGIAIILFAVGPKVFTNVSHASYMGLALIAYLVIAFMTVGFLFISNKVYWGNRWILTTDSITQMSQTSLFNNQSSQLSLGNLEDVTAEQNGLLTHMFNYGVLRVETAGERSKFLFAYCPNPNHYAQEVISAREKFEQKIREPQNTGINVGTEAAAQPPLPPQQPVA